MIKALVLVFATFVLSQSAFAMSDADWNYPIFLCRSEALPGCDYECVQTLTDGNTCDVSNSACPASPGIASWLKLDGTHGGWQLIWESSFPMTYCKPTGRAKGRVVLGHPEVDSYNRLFGKPRKKK